MFLLPNIQLSITSSSPYYFASLNTNVDRKTLDKCLSLEEELKRRQRAMSILRRQLLPWKMN